MSPPKAPPVLAGERLLLRPGEAGRRLGCGAAKVLRLVQEGKLRSVEVDGVVRVPEGAIKEYQSTSGRVRRFGNASRRSSVEDNGDLEAIPRIPVRSVIVNDPQLMPGPSGMILEGIDTRLKPVYSIGEVSKVFFARSTYWLRWAERKGYFTLDGHAVGDRRKLGADEIVHGGIAGTRTYCLNDIEEMAHALISHGAISGGKFRAILYMIANQARLYEYI